MLYIPFDEILTTLRLALEKAGFDGARAARGGRVRAQFAGGRLFARRQPLPALFEKRAGGHRGQGRRAGVRGEPGGMEVWDGTSARGRSSRRNAMAPGHEPEPYARHRLCVGAPQQPLDAAGPRRLAGRARGRRGHLFTNTTANMPAWGAVDAHLGNNPIVLAIPREKGPVVVDMAMSQFAYGKLEVAALSGEELPIDGGFDEAGNLTRDPQAILRTRRILPSGYWKGSAMSTRST